MLGRIAKYELIEKIGEGGMGVVFKARDSRLGSELAVKVLPEDLARDPEFRARFLREACAGAMIHHANIATCFDVDEAPLEPPDLLEPGRPGPHPARMLYLAMEYVPGTDLTAFIGERPIPLEQVLDLTHQIAAGLESAHRAGVIHRDLKPSNVRVTPDGQVKIVDFGLSRIERPKGESTTLTTSRNRYMGTPYYMAPEQANGRTTDSRSDLFSLGVLTYELVTGKRPFTGDTPAAINLASATVDPPPMARYASHVPDELERVVRKLMAKNPDDRYQSAHEVRTDLRRLKEEPHPVPEPRWRLWPRRAARPLAYGAAALTVAFGGWWGWQSFGPSAAHSIAVMPFRNLTGDPRIDYVCEGLAAGVVRDLVARTRITVSSLSSTRGLDSKTSAVGASRSLGVRTLLEGGFRRQAGVSYVDVQLVDGRLGYTLWSESYQYGLENSAAIQFDIVRAVVRRITGQTLSEPGPGSAGGPRVLSAYDLYLRAGSYLEDPDDPLGRDQALELYSQAIEIDPGFALAWAGKSNALVKIYNRDKDQASLHRAEEAANRAIQINQTLLEARVARAQIYRLTGRHQESIRELQEVLSVNPNWDEALVQLAASYRNAGEMVRALASARQAVGLRPGYWRNWDFMGALWVRSGVYDSARVAFGKVIRLAPEENRGYEQLAAIEMREFEYAAAMALYDRLPSPVADGTLASNIASANFFQRRLAQARRYYVLALSLEPRNYSYWRNFGDFHAREGRADSARAAYMEAVRLAEDQLHRNPTDLTLLLDRAVCLAKAGDCASARSSLAEIAGRLPRNDADGAHWRAKLHAVCGQRAAALQEPRRAVALGLPTRLLREEDEFAGFASDPGFLAITRGLSRNPRRLNPRFGGSRATVPR